MSQSVWRFSVIFTPRDVNSAHINKDSILDSFGIIQNENGWHDVSTGELEPLNDGYSYVFVFFLFHSVACGHSEQHFAKSVKQCCEFSYSYINLSEF
jgi:hypothetical protein